MKELQAAGHDEHGERDAAGAETGKEGTQEKNPEDLINDPSSVVVNPPLGPAAIEFRAHSEQHESQKKSDCRQMKGEPLRGLVSSKVFGATACFSSH